MNENIFRSIAAVVLFTGIGISVYFRRKADRDTGENISRKVDGALMMTVMKIGGLLLWFSPLIYLMNPRWMVWSKIGLPDWIRWTGAFLGVLCVLGIYWLFSSIGNNISPTSATRKEHKLVTTGIYRWVRDPLYTIGCSLFLAFGSIADNWFFILAGVLAFILMAIRTPKEEVNLLEKFGNEYREYAKRTGRSRSRPRSPASCRCSTRRSAELRAGNARGARAPSSEGVGSLASEA